MGLSQNAADAYAFYKKVKKIKTYSKLVVEAVNEDTRTGAVMKLGIRGMLEIAGKLLGASLTSHPYFTYHKVHLEALAQALNASSNQDQAREALNRAIRSADAAAELTKAVYDYRRRKDGLKLSYIFIAGSLNVLRDRATNPQAAREIKEAGQTPESLQASADENIYEWRALWCELLQDVTELLAMAQVEYRLTDAAMQRFNEKMKALSSGGNMGKIAAYGMEQERQWKQFDRMTQPGTGSEKAVEDPVGYALDQVNTIQDLTDRVGEGCDAAMSDDAYRTEKIIHRIDKL